VERADHHVFIIYCLQQDIYGYEAVTINGMVNFRTRKARGKFICLAAGKKTLKRVLQPNASSPRQLLEVKVDLFRRAIEYGEN
jgi:hypothetical protein